MVLVYLPTVKGDSFRVNVGNYSSTMEQMGIIILQLQMSINPQERSHAPELHQALEKAMALWQQLPERSEARGVLFRCSQ